MTASPLPDLECYRGYLLILAECGLSPRLRVKVDPSDIVQQTLLEAHRDLPSYRGQTEAELKSWLRTILTRNLYNVARRFQTQGRDVDLEQQVAGSLEQSSMRIDKFLASEQTSPSQKAMQNELFEQLADGLAQLLEGERTAIMLKHFQGWSLAEISEQMGRPPDAIAGLLKRGLKKLRIYLQQDTE
jgi:RNA polymerase sigma-70 factor (ECF subfamily)